MDGGYVIKRLEGPRHRFPSATTIRRLAAELVSRTGPASLYRVFFYHADPYRGSLRRPVLGERIRFESTRTAREHRRLLRELEGSRDFAVRRGEVVFRGWRIRRAVQRQLQTEPERPIAAGDFVPDLVQKGVDMRIGLDIAALALKRLVDTVVVVSGDADMVPAMRFARREGLRVGLCTLSVRGTNRELRAHADFMLDWTPETAPAATTASVPVSPASSR